MNHTDACVAARSGPKSWPLIAPTIPVYGDNGSVHHEPNPAAVAIFACPHWSHDAYRMIWGWHE